MHRNLSSEDTLKKDLKLPRIDRKKETIKTLEDDIQKLNKLLSAKLNRLNEYKSIKEFKKQYLFSITIMLGRDKSY